MNLDHVLLSSPSLLATIQLAAEEADKTKARRSWIQLARTGAFVSNRYGKFAITKDDLSQMLHNFNEVTPKAPTELPIDYDHKSMEPKGKDDGIAAGWMKKLELREDGDELWGEIEWTPPAAEKIDNKEYRFVSPSFVKNHTHKDGKKIGTTLLAAAITNHPFLEGMQAVSLYSCKEVPFLDFTKVETRDVSAHEVLNLDTNEGTKAGQRVMVAPGNARTQDEIGATFEIAEVVGEGDDAFVSVKDANGMIHKWFRATELLPASATPANPQHPGLVPGAMPTVPVQAGPAAVPGPNGLAPTPTGLDPSAAGPPGVIPPGAPPGTPGAEPNPTATVNPTDPNAPPLDPGAPKPPVPPDPAAADAKATLAGAEPADPRNVADKAEQTGEVATETSAKAAETADKATKVAKVADKVATATETTPAWLGALGIPDELKKAIAAALAAQGGAPANPLQKGMHMKFQLNNDKGEAVEITSEQLEAAGVKIVKEGEVVIPKTDLTDLQGKVTSLSSTVETMKTENAAQAQASREREVTGELDRLSQGGFITKPTRDALFEQFKGSTDLSAFRAITATFNTPILSLNKEHGSGGKAAAEKTNGEEAADKLINLSRQIAKDEGISLRDATIKAGAQMADEAEAYREQFADTH